MSGVFQFKQFTVDQTGCAMKINTDGVLLGALAGEGEPQSILDIGTGTGVIALMLAQRFHGAAIDAIEIDENAAKTAQKNFKTEPFLTHFSLFLGHFSTFFEQNETRKFDLIVSNPPFYINSLESPKAARSVAKHAGRDFFEKLVGAVPNHLNTNGACWLILPLQTAGLVKDLAKQHGLHLQKVINVHSFENDEPHREIMVLGIEAKPMEISKLVIYESVGNYTADYKGLLKPYFLAF